MSYLDTVKNTDVGTYDSGTYEGPPRLYWRNGDKKQGTPGYFYVKADELRGEVPGEPWQEVEIYQGEIGYMTQKLRVAPIGYRSQPFLQVGDERRWLTEWTEGARFHTELLCFAQGLEHMAPVCWVSKGMISKALTQKGEGVLSLYREHLLGPASKQAGRTLPLWTFWLPIATRREGEAIVYADTGFKNIYTPPAVHPAALRVEAADKLFVGEELYKIGDVIRIEHDTWLKARRGGVEAAEQASDELFEGQAAPAAPQARRKVVLDEADLPF